jgi:hypothetical protein
MTDIKLVAYIYEVNGERVELLAELVDVIKKSEIKPHVVQPSVPIPRGPMWNQQDIWSIPCVTSVSLYNEKGNV